MAKKVDVSAKLDKIIKNQNKIIKNQDKILKEELTEKKAEKELGAMERREIKELQELKELEKKIKFDIEPHPLRKITYRDFTRGMIGAFVGIVAHFSFVKGVHLAEHFSVYRATLLFVASFLLGFLYLYFSGFKKVEKVLVMKFIPLRLLVIYGSAILVTIVVLWLFGELGHGVTFIEGFKMVSGISVLAVLGACTADLIGGGE